MVPAYDSEWIYHSKWVTVQAMNRCSTTRTRRYHFVERFIAGEVSSSNGYFFDTSSTAAPRDKICENFFNKYHVEKSESVCMPYIEINSSARLLYV